MSLFRMKKLVLVLALGIGSALSARGDDFLSFRAEPFGLEDAERLAAIEFEKRHGACGITIFKEKRFEAWVFETRIGYAGIKGPDIVVFSTTPSEIPLTVAAEKKKPNLESSPAQQPTPNSG